MSEGYESDPDAEPEVDSWIRIQQHTFTNWVNDKLRIHDLEVKNLRTDLKDGVLLCRLMEALKRHRIGKIIQKPNLNHYEASGNMQLAFNAMKKDGVKLVNIGAEDVRSGNIKLILGMIWTLIRFYQIGSQSKLPAKALMLSWCNAVLHPYMRVQNFASDWQDGVALHGLIEYCQPDTFPAWHQLSRSNALANCEAAMHLAADKLGVSMVMQPEHMASADTDELSRMTYLSYFMAEESAGYKATLGWVREQISPEPLNNFDKDWNNGFILTRLVRSLGATVPDSEGLDWEMTNNNAIDAARNQLNIQPVLKANDLIQPDVDHIGVMAHAAWHEASLRNNNVITEPPREPSPDIVIMDAPPEPSPPDSPVHTTVVTIGDPSEGASEVKVIINDNWRIDATMTIEVDTSNIGSGTITGKAESLTGSRQDLVSSRCRENIHFLEFSPTEIGTWSVHVFYNGDDVMGSPYDVNVYDPSAAKITRDYGVAAMDESYTFEVDVMQVGLDDVDVYIVHEGSSISHDTTRAGMMKHRVRFTPEEEGSYTVSVYCGGVEVPGSPFDVVCKLVEGIEVRGRGLTEGVANQETRFELDTSASPGKDIDICVFDSDGVPITPRVQPEAGGALYTIFFTPTKPGPYKIEVMYDGVHISGSPFTADIRKPSVHIQDMSPYAIVGQKSRFKIDASEMKKGTLEIDSDLPVVSYDKVGQNTYIVTFVPKKIGHHDLVIKYNNIEVDGCPFDIDVKPSL